MGIPNVLLLGLSRPMCLSLFLRDGFRQAGCRVRTAGPNDPEVYGHTFPDEDWDRTDYSLPVEVMDVNVPIEMAIADGFKPDLVVMADQYDFFFVTGQPHDKSIKFCWVAVENFNEEQAHRATMRKADAEFHMIFHTQNNTATPVEGSEWLPFGFDPAIHAFTNQPRDKVCVQIGTHYQPRPIVWNLIRQRIDGAPEVAPDTFGHSLQESASTLFGKVFNYRDMVDAYNRGICALSASNCDFLPMRVFEAFGQGCILISDDVPAIRAACGPPLIVENGEVKQWGLWVAHDATPIGIATQVEHVRDMPEQIRTAVAGQAFATAYAQHTYMHRCRRILEKVGLRGACRMIAR